MRRIGAGGAALAVVIGVLLAVSTALANRPGNSPNAKMCQKSGWMSLYTRSGQPFSSEEACTSYAAMGGQLIVEAALGCLNNGWTTLGPTSAQPFASEQACVDFVNGGGTPVAAGADLSIAKTVDDATPNVGDTVTFTITLADNGPAAATNVQVTDLLPVGLTFISSTPSQGNYLSGSGLWTVGTVTTSTPQTLHIQARVDSSSTQTNTAMITHSDQYDPDTTNNSASAAETPTGSAFPLKVSSNGRYLVDQNGVPFLMVGDSPQSAIGNLSLSEAQRYFADREAHGFNTVWINLLCDAYTACNSNGTTYDGIAPFTSGSGPTSYDVSTENPAYFTRADSILNAAAADGLTVMLDPIETGGSQASGWLQTLRNNGAAKDYAYGQWLGTHYKTFPNIIWMSGNDFQTWTDATDDNVVQQVALGIQNTDPAHLQTLEMQFCTGGGDTCIGYSSLDDTTHDWTGLLKLNGSYTYSPTYAEDLHAYNQSPTIPMFLVEANYENEQNPYTDGCYTVRNCRLQEYWTMTSGATGQLYGNHYTWTIANGWSSANLDTVGVTQLGYLTSLLTGREWYNLVPDQAHMFVTAGYGTCPTTGSMVGVNCVTSAVTPDGKFGLVYIPLSQAVTVAMSKMSGPVTAQWFDPTNGTYVTVGGGPFDNTGTETFTPSATNSAGDSDWVLVLTASGG
jgi:uncharacterized repeat protein (TIGR01451 family)